VNKVIWGILAGIALGAAGTVIVLKYPNLLDYAGADKEQEAPEQTEESFLQHDADGRVSVKLDQNAQTHMGLKVQPLAAAELSPEVKGYGRVLDPAPLAALVAEGTSAQAALQASTKDFERLTILYSQNQNASARALETAEAAMKHDQISLASVQSRLLLGWGGAIASQADPAAFVHSLAAQETALVRVDLPLGERLPTAPMGGRIAPLGAPEHLSDTQYLGPAPSADPQTQSRGVLLLVKVDPPPPNTAVLAWLAIPGQPQSGVIVPRSALLRHESRTFVYLQTAADTFERKAVTLGRPAGDGWFVGQGFKPQDKVVVVGAQELLSEELKGQGGGE
jgi:hypothetical protein